MNCLKCGRETPAEQVFCEDCLLEMEKHPIKPGTVVLLPRRRETASIKKTVKKKVLSAEEQIRLLRRHLRVVYLILVLCISLILAMVYPSVQYLMKDRFKIGQNYTSVTVPTVPAAVHDTAGR